ALLVALLVDVGLERLDLALDGGDAAVDPLVHRLAGVQQLQDGVDGGEVEPPEDRGAGGAEDGQEEAAPVGPGVPQGAEGGSHVPRGRGPGVGQPAGASWSGPGL